MGRATGIDPRSKLHSWRRQFLDVKEKVILDEDRPANILKLAEHGIKLKKPKEKRNASSSRRKGHRG